MTRTIEATQHVVLRSFEGAGVVRECGEVLDTSEWARLRLQQLVSTRYLAPATSDITPVSCPCGRMWKDEDARLSHDCHVTGGVPAGSKPRSPRRGRSRRKT